MLGRVGLHCSYGTVGDRLPGRLFDVTSQDAGISLSGTGKAAIDASLEEPIRFLSDALGVDRC